MDHPFSPLMRTQLLLRSLCDDVVLLGCAHHFAAVFANADDERHDVGRSDIPAGAIRRPDPLPAPLLILLVLLAALVELFHLLLQFLLSLIAVLDAVDKVLRRALWRMLRKMLRRWGAAEVVAAGAGADSGAVAMVTVGMIVSGSAVAVVAASAVAMVTVGTIAVLRAVAVVAAGAVAMVTVGAIAVLRTVAVVVVDVHDAWAEAGCEARRKLSDLALLSKQYQLP